MASATGGMTHNSVMLTARVRERRDNITAQYLPPAPTLNNLIVPLWLATASRWLASSQAWAATLLLNSKMS